MPKYRIPVWKMCKEAASELPEAFSPTDMVRKIHEKHPQVKESTIRAHVIALSPNHPSFKHYGMKHRLFYYLGNGRYRLLRPEEGGKLPEEEEKVVQPHNPLLTTAIYSLMNALEFFQRGEERHRQGAMISMDQAVEYVLKAKLYQIDHIKFMKSQLEQLDYLGAMREVEKSGATILEEEKVELKKMHGARNYAQHRAVIPDSVWTREYMRWVHKFIRRFILENFQINIDHQIPLGLRTGL